MASCNKERESKQDDDVQSSIMETPPSPEAPEIQDIPVIHSTPVLVGFALVTTSQSKVVQSVNSFAVLDTDRNPEPKVASWVEPRKSKVTSQGIAAATKALLPKRRPLRKSANASIEISSSQPK
ncbi:hypothetical protein SLA2020_152860 [Shorea laevis]